MMKTEKNVQEYVDVVNAGKIISGKQAYRIALNTLKKFKKEWKAYIKKENICR